MWFKWYVWDSNLNLLAISGLCIREYSHQTSNSGCIKQWKWLPRRCPRPPPRHSAKKLDRFSFFPPLRAHSCQRHSAATFAVSASAKAESRSIFAECRGVAAADATFSAPNGIVCGRLNFVGPWAIHILLQDVITSADIALAESLLVEFVTTCEALYGHKFMTSNVHQLFISLKALGVGDRCGRIQFFHLKTGMAVGWNLRVEPGQWATKYSNGSRCYAP